MPTYAMIDQVGDLCHNITKRNLSSASPLNYLENGLQWPQEIIKCRVNFL